MTTRPIDTPAFWKDRLLTEPTKESAVWICTKEQWDLTEIAHSKELAVRIQPNDSILDVGCAYGRLLTLLPSTWQGQYLGIDVSPDFISLAISSITRAKFVCGDLAEELAKLDDLQFDWAICVMFWELGSNNMPPDKWAVIERNIKRVANRILILEPFNPGIVINNT